MTIRMLLTCLSVACFLVAAFAPVAGVRFEWLGAAFYVLSLSM